jgi:hypothetical protein
MNIIKELSVFNNIVYHDEPHKYYIDGEQMISTTTLIHKYSEPFDSDNIAPGSGKKWASKWEGSMEFDREFVQDVWKWLNVHATTEGSILHDYIENRFNNKVFPFPIDRVIKEFGYNAIEKTYPILQGYADNFFNDCQDKLIPVKAELVIGDKELGLCGMVDMLFWNETAQEYQIWDWKTNTKLRDRNEWGTTFTGILSELDDCEMETYSLQLSTYRYIIEKNTNIKLGDSYIVWFNENNPNYKIFQTYDYREIVEKMLEDYNK